MSEPASHFGNDPRGSVPPGAAGPADPPAYPHCFRCQTDLTHCFLSARFCPRCGAVLAALPGEAPQPPAAPPPLPLPALSLEPPDRCGTHSLILGYANAMFRLGWRYENGDRTARNPHEAIRCYFKAAKLGNASALARLTPPAELEPARSDSADAPTVD